MQGKGGNADMKTLVVYFSAESGRTAALVQQEEIPKYDVLTMMF